MFFVDCSLLQNELKYYYKYYDKLIIVASKQCDYCSKIIHVMIVTFS